LSQLPPVHLLLKPRRLEVEVHSRIQITHKVGNPNASLYVGIRNSGGRELHVRSVILEFCRDGKCVATLPSQSYFQNAGDTTPVLFVPFPLKPNEQWAHVVSFFPFFDRPTEKLYRERGHLLQNEIQAKIAARPEWDKAPVKAAPELVGPFVDLFTRLFVWEVGEYVATLTVKADPGSASYSKRYRFTLYESDNAELRKHVEDYEYGAGINFLVDSHAGVFVPLSEDVG
jgi:hypothetical protein